MILPTVGPEIVLVMCPSFSTTFTTPLFIRFQSELHHLPMVTSLQRFRYLSSVVYHRDTCLIYIYLAIIAVSQICPIQDVER